MSRFRLKYMFTFLITIIIIILVCFIVLVNCIEFNVLTSNSNQKQLVYLLSPQGWAFFTRNPREAQVLLYKIEKNHIYNLHHKHSHYSNFFGLSRNCTKLFSELQLLKINIPDSFYTDISFNFMKNMLNKNIDLKNIKIIKLKNQFKNQFIMGTYLFLIQEMLPWAWLKSRNNIKLKAKAVILNVS